jgi:putative transposase
MKISTRVEHRPIHFYRDQTIYFVTFRTINRINFLNTDQKKQIVSRVIQKAIKNFFASLYAWVILDNHFHLLFLLPLGSSLPRFAHNISANVTRCVNQLDGIRNRKLFNNYWDYCIRDEADFWKHFNYIHHNPVKHGYVKSQQKCQSYKFCSAKQWVEKNGEGWLDSCFEKYPIVDFTVQED